MPQAVSEGQANAPLFTLLSGWAFRFKTLSDGRRQILNFLLPSDFIGVRQKMADASAHGVQALTDALLSVGRRSAEERIATLLLTHEIVARPVGLLPRRKQVLPALRSAPLPAGLLLDTGESS